MQLTKSCQKVVHRSVSELRSGALVSHYSCRNTASRYHKKYQRTPLLQPGCGVGVEESEGFSTWGVGFAENVNDSDSAQTFRSPIVTVCATNVRKRHIWQFKQLGASTRDDHGYSDRR